MKKNITAKNKNSIPSSSWSSDSQYKVIFNTQLKIQQVVESHPFIHISIFCYQQTKRGEHRQQNKVKFDSNLQKGIKILTKESEKKISEIELHEDGENKKRK